ncbi:MAG: class I SAM-dependent methyltransferase [Sphingosinicella sp.]
MLEGDYPSPAKRGTLQILDSDLSISPEELAARPHGELLGLDDCEPLLASPDSRRPLHREGDGFSDGKNAYQIRGDLPILMPVALQPFFSSKLVVPFANHPDSLLQYFLLATIKQAGDINAPASADHFHRHLFRACEFLADARGLVLDVGCDDPLVGASLFSDKVRYVGLDPFCMRETPFRIIGVGEFLPFRDGVFEGAVFNTSLDHILDWHSAIEEAARVLKAGGSLYLLTYAWTDRATLISDIVHFHHFRDYEIFGGLAECGFEIAAVKRWASPKGDPHRHELFVRAVKR